MKYLLIALIFTQTTLDHGTPIKRHLGSYETLEECETGIEFIKNVYFDGSLWMSPNSAPESIVRVRYTCIARYSHGIDEP